MISPFLYVLKHWQSLLRDQESILPVLKLLMRWCMDGQKRMKIVYKLKFIHMLWPSPCLKKCVMFTILLLLEFFLFKSAVRTQLVNVFFKYVNLYRKRSHSWVARPRRYQFSRESSLRLPQGRGEQCGYPPAGWSKLCGLFMDRTALVTRYKQLPCWLKSPHTASQPRD